MTLAHRPEHYSHVLSCVDWAALPDSFRRVVPHALDVDMTGAVHLGSFAGQYGAGVLGRARSRREGVGRWCFLCLEKGLEFLCRGRFEVFNVLGSLY